MSEHTPGPWTPSGICNPLDAERRSVFVAGPTPPGMQSGPAICEVNTPDRNEANLRLIAAAPDLLEAVEYLLGQWIYPDHDHEGDHLEDAVPRREIRALVARVKGADEP